MTEEIWKDVVGYEGLYQVSNLGRIKNNKGKIKAYFLKREGYLSTHLYKNGKETPVYAHRVVAEAFIPNPENLPQVNHKDLNKKNNNVDNLEWCSRKENINHAIRNGVNRYEGKKIMCVETGKVYRNSIVAGEETGILAAGIRMNLCGKHKYAGGYHWIHV